MFSFIYCIVSAHNVNKLNDFSLTIDDCDKFTKKEFDKKEERWIYIFDYDGIPLDRKIFKSLKNNKRWCVLKHPYIINYINETLIRLTPFYVLYLFTYVIFLSLLYFHIHDFPTNLGSIILVMIFDAFFIGWVSNSFSKLKFSVNALLIEEIILVKINVFEHYDVNEGFSRERKSRQIKTISSSQLLF